MSSRICHDLAGPIGALGTGIELLEMTSGEVSPELALLGEGLRLADARLRFLRVAFGSAAGGEVAAAELSELLATMNAGTRITSRWDDGGALPRPIARLGCLLQLCAEAALPRGGTVTLRRTGGGVDAMAQAAATVALDPELAAHLHGSGAAPLGPRDIQFPLAHQAATSLGLRIEVRRGTDSLRLTAA